MAINHEVLKAITNFDEEKKKIFSNRELSDIGKQEAWKRIGAQHREYRGEALRLLKRDWNSTRKRFKDLAARQLDAEEAAAAGWDYQRLNYEAAAISSAFSTARDMLALEDEYNNFMVGGDKHKARAAAEIGGAVIRERFGGSSLEAGASRRELIIRRMEKDLEELLATDELRQINTEGEQLTNSIIDLAKVTKVVASHYEGVHPGEFTALMEGVSISEKWCKPGNPERLTQTTVEISD